MQEFFVRFECSVRKFPCRFCCIQHNQSSKYVCLNKNFRITDTSVYMTLCCKMNDSINVIFIKDLHDCLAVTNISFHKCVIFTVFNIFQIFKISCISQFIYIDNTDLVVIFFKHIMNIVGSDKSCTTSYKVCSHYFTFLLKSALHLGERCILLFTYKPGPSGQSSCCLLKV